MNIIFASHSPLDSNSGLHIIRLADSLNEMGHKCLVLVPQPKKKLGRSPSSHFEVRSFDEINENAALFPGNQKPDLIHAWTPREIIRDLLFNKLQGFKIPYIIHLEDNEEAITQTQMGDNYSSEYSGEFPSHLSHPIHYRQLMESSSGVTALIEPLLKFKPSEKPGLVFWPGYDSIFRATEGQQKAIKRRLNIPDEHWITAYTGNCHHSNFEEIYTLYLAIHTLNRVGIKITLIRTGIDHVELIPENLSLLRENCIELGYVDRQTLAEVTHAADFLIQPGKSNEFNDYRFPSKIPDFLASGKPLILPETNIGKHMTDGVNAILLRKGHALEIVDKVRDLIADPNKTKNIGAEGARFAHSKLCWKDKANLLENFYRQVINYHQGLSVENSQPAIP